MTFGDVRFRLSKLCPGVDADSLDGAIVDAYQSILDRRAWALLRAEGSFPTVAPYTDGTMSLTNGSLAVTGSGTVWTAAMVGRGVHLPGRNEAYRFNYIGQAAGSLDRAYEGPTGAAVGYKIYQDIYELPDDFERPAAVALNSRVDRTLEHMDLALLRRSAPARLVFGEPAVYSLVMPGPPLPLQADEDNDLARAQLYPIPNFAASYPYTYIRKVPRFADGDTDVAILPWVSVKALMDLARAAIEGDRKNYTGQTAYTATAEREIASMMLDDAKLRGPQKMRMAPAYTRHRIARALRSALPGGRF